MLIGCLLKWAKCRQESVHCHENLTFALPEFMCVIVSPLASAGGGVFMNNVGLTVTFNKCHRSLVLCSLNILFVLSNTVQYWHVLYHASAPGFKIFFF